MEKYAFFIMIFIIFLIIGIIIFIKKMFDKWRIKILDNSSYIKQINRINSMYQFRKIDKKIIRFNYRCSSKKEYDNYNFEKYISVYIDENRLFLNDLVKDIEYNKKLIGEYDLEYKQLTSINSISEAKQLKIPYSYYRKIETKYKISNRKNPTLTVMLSLSKSYVSPQGYNKYQHSYPPLTIDDIKSKLELVDKMIRENKYHQYSVNIERAKMTDSLRYDILRRDGFKCQICGATVQDGIKLHVDHIIPVSKGGKTIPSNLRTLCDRCNLGKSDKIE